VINGNILKPMYSRELNFIPLPLSCFTHGYNRLRRAKLRMFSECLMCTAEYNNAAYTRQFDIVDRLERSCLNESIIMCKIAGVDATWANERFIDTYHAINAKVAANIDANSCVANINLINDIMCEKIVLENIPSMSSVELFPDKYTELHAKIARSANATFSVTVSTRFKCPKCHANACTIESVQTRSFDEPATLRATCVPCGFGWRV
jgi:DNA-directed RNA polymerase subunit M/transcription elongation factor TFIIS